MIVFKQSGVIPYRVQEGKVEILLITSSDRQHWIIPKGLVEWSMTPAKSAAKEAWEEAGITGTVDETAIGIYEYRKWGGVCQVEVFLMRVETIADSFPEVRRRNRQWLSLPKAIERIQEADLRQIMESLTLS